MANLSFSFLHLSFRSQKVIADVLWELSSVFYELFPESDWNADYQSGVDRVTNEQSFYLNASVFQRGSPIRQGLIVSQEFSLAQSLSFTRSEATYFRLVHLI